jgi:hypothetical protein
MNIITPITSIPEEQIARGAIKVPSLTKLVEIPITKRESFKAEDVKKYAPAQKIVYIEKPCDCGKRSNSNTGKVGGGKKDSIAVVSTNLTLDDSTKDVDVVIIDSEKTVRITLPKDLPSRAAKGFVHPAKQVTIKSLSNRVSHEIYTQGNANIQGYKSFRLMPGHSVNFYGVGDSWYTV